MLANIFIFHDPAEVVFASWLRSELEQSGYAIVRSLEQAQIVLFIVTSAALQSPWLRNLEQQILQKRDQSDLELLLGAVIRDNTGYRPDQVAGTRYDFVVDFQRDDQQSALSELVRRIEGKPDSWRAALSPAAESRPDALETARVHPMFPHETFVEWVERAQTRVLILSTFTTLIDHRDALLSAVRRGAEVQISLLEPNSPLAKQRAQDLYRFGQRDDRVGDDEVSQFVRESVHIFNELYGEAEALSGTFELRFYATMPSFPIYIADENALVGFYPHAVRSTQFPYVEIRTTTRFGSEVIREFERIWADATPHQLPTASEAVRQANEKLADPLTPSELRVLSLVCKGMSNQEIADELVVQYSTIRAHKNHIYSKLGIASSPALLVIRAQELGLVSR